MKVIAVVLSALTLAFVSATFNVAKTHGNNDTMFEQSKIVGGAEIDISYVSSQVVILENNKLICSASIIKPKTLLSGAHCLENTNIEELKIRSGSNYHASGGRVVSVIGATKHPNYRSKHKEHFDLAILFLADSALAPGIAAAIIVLWHTGAVFSPGTYGTLAGWGATEEGGNLSPVLKRVALPILSHEDCAFCFNEFIATHCLCAGFKEGGRDGCTGDSGAGLVIGTKLAGVSSFGLGCGREQTPSVFTSVLVFRAWILEVAGV